MSAFYHFRISREGLRVNGSSVEKAKITALSESVGNAQVAYLSTSEKSKRKSTPELNSPDAIFSNRNVRQSAASYAFIAVTERFDESLVLLAHKWGLQLVDMLYVRSKDSHMDPTGTLDLNKGVEVVPHVPIEKESVAVQRAAQSFRTRSGADVELLRIANKRLDAAAEVLDSEHRPGFTQAEVAKFKSMIAELERVCRPRFFEACLWGDNGCAQTCIDETVEAKGWARHGRSLLV